MNESDILSRIYPLKSSLFIRLVKSLYRSTRSYNVLSSSNCTCVTANAELHHNATKSTASNITFLMSMPSFMYINPYTAYVRQRQDFSCPVKHELVQTMQVFHSTPNKFSASKSIASFFKILNALSPFSLDKAFSTLFRFHPIFFAICATDKPLLYKSLTINHL